MYVSQQRERDAKNAKISQEKQQHYYEETASTQYSWTLFSTKNQTIII